MDTVLPSKSQRILDAVPELSSTTGLLPGGTASGCCLHEILETIPFETFEESPSLESWRERDDVKRTVSRAMRRNGIDRRFRPEAERLVHTALASPVRLGETTMEGGFRSASKLVREVEFVYPYPRAETADPESERGFVKGFVDFVFEHDGLVYLCDWKSDALPHWSERALEQQVERNYRLQMKIYALAVAKMLGVEKDADHRARFGGVVFCFLRGMPRSGIYFERPSWDRVQQWRDQLSREKRL